MKTTTESPAKDNIIYCDYTHDGESKFGVPFKEVPVGARINSRTMNGKPIESVNPSPFIKQ